MTGFYFSGGGGGGQVFGDPVMGRLVEQLHNLIHLYLKSTKYYVLIWVTFHKMRYLSLLNDIIAVCS